MSSADDSIAPLQILYSDESILVVNKPPGLLAHRSKIAAGEKDDLLTRLREQTGRGSLRLVHRLDRATSGVVLCCDDKPTHVKLGHAFEHRQVDKSYLAIARGWPTETSGLIDHPLSGERKNSPQKVAQTRYRVIDTCELPWPSGRWETARYALIETNPLTGRYRQIRRHLKHLGHPLIGDTSFGKGDHNRLFRMHLGVHRMLLHAQKLSFEHPTSGERMEIEAPLDGDWEKVLELFKAVPNSEVQRDIRRANAALSCCPS